MRKHAALGMVLCALMISSALATRALRPAEKVVDLKDQIKLDSMIPATFGNWTIDASVVPVQVDPELQRNLNNLYNQTLSRTYINRAGERVMLSIAYGGDQSGNLELHRPEACYTGQGFAVTNIRSEQLRSPYGTFPLTRLSAVANSRHEPVSYWMTVGDRTVKNGLEQKIQKFRFMLTGKIPDGMLVRVSTVDTDEAASYRQQDAFVNDLLGALSPQDRARLVGFETL
ncbi:exosortase-associated protein EpsI, B-type [Janthinobacterium sp.]|uniref:exosortase-associated protein EpsI, B-type n=1 Tax=Janthinobacterium sp. TaxID=1871054 RepID=UPI00293D218B|nr:exosortase-associated protein EpsI, B-type [Janthinobacterium sp.]